MKVFIPNIAWIGGTADFVSRAFTELGVEVRMLSKHTHNARSPILSRLSNQITRVAKHREKQQHDLFNAQIIREATEFKPDLFFSINARFYPETVSIIKDTLKCKMVCWVADNPFDSTRFRWFPMNLKYFDHLFLGDMIWYQNIHNLAPESQIDHLVGAVDTKTFYPTKVSEELSEQFSCNLSFAGSAYGMKAEGTYRSGILDQIVNYGLNIWGDDNWEMFFKYYPSLKKSFRGSRLSFNDLNLLYQCSKINLNIPNPQCFTSFQQRIFEISASKSFQIVDYRSDIVKYFNEEEIVSFKTISDLKEKLEYFLEDPNHRIKYINNSYQKVTTKHTYKHRMADVLNRI